MARHDQASNALDLKQLFAKRDEPYAGADVVLSRYALGLVSLLTSLLVALFLPLAPPTRSVIGWFGLPIAILAVVGGFRGGRRLLAPTCEHGFDRLLLWSYLGLGRIVLLDWLAGGGGSPYQALAVISMTGAVGVHHPRRGATFLLILLPALAAPLLYGGWSHDVFVHAATNLALCWSIGILLLTYIAKMRMQRVAMRAGEAEANQLARADALTGLGNRRAFDEALGAEIARTRRARSPLSIAMIDLDGLKEINDESGHLEGDRALREVACALAHAVRGADRCFRWAGDEFAVILPDTSAEEAANLRERLVEEVRSSCRTSQGGVLTISCGIAELGEGDALTLTSAADEDLFAQKTGRGRAQPVG